MARGRDDGLATLTVLAWEGPLPDPGHWLATSSGRTAYLIHEVVLPTRPGTRHVARLRVERHRPADVPAGARVHAWSWGSRDAADRAAGR